MALKRRALDPMAETCWKTPARRKALEAFLTDRPELDAYARFRATASTQGKSWHDWPQALRDGVHGDAAPWAALPPARMTMASPDPQAFRPDPARPGLLQVSLASNAIPLQLLP